MQRFVSMMIGLLAVAIVFVPQVASADLGDVLGDIEWGDDKEQVLEKLRTEMLQELREDRSLRNDQAAMQRARQGALDRVRRIEDSFYELQGNSTNYDVSVISSEFTANNDESLLRVRDDAAQRFYLFLDGEFYKLVVAYDQDHIANVTFDAFLNQVQRQYGQPTSTEYGTVQGEEGVTEALWRDGEYKLRITDLRDYFGTFTMTFSDREKVQQLNAQDRTFGGNDQEPEEAAVSDRVRSLSQDSEGDVDQGSVGEMVGEIDVELPSREEREEEQEEEEEASSPSPTPSASAQEEEESTPSRPQPAASDDDDDDDDLVIY